MHCSNFIHQKPYSLYLFWRVWICCRYISYDDLKQIRISIFTIVTFSGVCPYINHGYFYVVKSKSEYFTTSHFQELSDILKINLLLERATCVLCYSNQGLFIARFEDGLICSIDWVSKCLTVPENGMNIDLYVVKYSEFDFNTPLDSIGHVKV